MEITEIRIKLMESSEDRLQAFCSITIDQSFVVRDLKIIDGSNGPFVAMPSRKLTGHCSRCGSKNHLRAGYCNHCGAKQQSNMSHDGPQKLYADVAHPINSECREMIQDAVIAEFQRELQLSNQPGYRSRYDDDFDAGDYDAADYESETVATANSSERSTKKAVSKTSDEVSTASNADSGSDGLTGGFGAGLLDTEPSSTERTVPTRMDASVVGDEKSPGSRVPKPHFNQNPGESGGAHRVSSPTGSPSAEESPSIEATEDDDFGAGLFDD